MRIKCYILFFIVISFLRVQGQTVEINYQKSEEDFPNPERGFYVPIHGGGGELKLSDLNELRGTYKSKSPRAKYSSWTNLIYRDYRLTEFREKGLSDEFLRNIRNDFSAIREAGLKVILRFTYINSSKKGDCPDKSICPPYGDAEKKIVLQHIKQLKPVLMENADVISVLQEGFIGIWGENYYTDYFGDPSANGKGYLSVENWNDRNEVLKALLDAMPKDRMVQVRTPQIKQRYVYGPQANVLSPSLKESEAFNHSEIARIGFHNDCFLASKTDYGTFSDYGDDKGKKIEANEVLREYFIKDSKYLAIGGETCDNNFSPQNDCEPMGYAIKEMSSMHYSYLNSGYNNQVNNDWQDQGCMDEIKKRLGYRFVLNKGVFPSNPQIGNDFKFELHLENVGFASPYNYRPVHLVFRNTATKKKYTYPLQTNIQKWYSGAISVSEVIKLNKSMESGEYELLLEIPDAYNSLAGRPQYSIRLANENLWEEKTGLNKLNKLIKL